MGYSRGVQQCAPTIGRFTHNNELNWQVTMLATFGGVGKMLSGKKFRYESIQELTKWEHLGAH